MPYPATDRKPPKKIFPFLPVNFLCVINSFPEAGTIEDNLTPGDRIYRFKAECYQLTTKAIKIWHDIWLPKSQIKILWGDPQIDGVKVELSVPRWLIKKTMLNDYLKVG